MATHLSILLLLTSITLLELSSSSPRFIKKDNARLRLLTTVENKIEKAINTKIFFIKDYKAYSLKNLQASKDHTSTYLNNTLYYNFGNNTVTKCNKADSNSTMIMIKKQDNSCVRVAGSINGTQTSKNVWEIFEKHNKTGIRIKLSEGDKCIANPSKKYEVAIELTCNEAYQPNKTSLDFTQLLEAKQCSYVVEGESLEACPQKYRYIFQSLMHQYRYVVSIVLVALGVLMALFGTKYQNISIIFISLFLIGSVLITLVTRFYPIEDLKTAYIAIAVSAVAGAIGGFFLSSLLQVFLALLSLFSGYSLGIEVHARYIYYFDWEEDVMYWVFIAVFAILMGVLMYFIFKQVLIILTAVCGGYFVAKGTGLVFGGMVDIVMIRDLKKFKEIEALRRPRNLIVYFYLALWILVTVIGLVMQFKKGKKKDKKNKVDEEKGIPLK